MKKRLREQQCNPADGISPSCQTLPGWPIAVVFVTVWMQDEAFVNSENDRQPPKDAP
jgi:hypothetical protein